MSELTDVERARIRAALRAGGEAARAARERLSPFRRFKPRPDNPDLYDQQSGYVGSTHKVSVLLGGTGAGKTEAAAFRVANRLRNQAPYRPRCPYWVIGESYEQVCGVCWVEKLSKYIPESMFYCEPVWLNVNLRWPKAVLLKHPTIKNEVGWVIEFRSFEQGRSKLQASSIGGAWFNEQPPIELVDEVVGRTRDYDSPVDIDFTPLKQSAEWPKRFRKNPEGWKFFRVNSELNTALAEGWAERFLSSIPSDYRETRRTGLFAAMEGAVFKDFNYDYHVVEPFPIPETARRLRGIDFGYVNPFACVRWARLPYSVALSDGRIAREGTWVCYHEYSQRGKLLKEHAEAIISVEHWDYQSYPQLYGPTVADHDPQDAAELRKEGVPTVPADKGENSVEIGLYAMKKLMMGGTNLHTPQLLIFNTCEKLIDEIQGYQYDKATETHDSRGVPLKLNDHLIDASRYALVEGLHRAGEFPTEALDLRKQPQWRDASKEFLGR